MSDVDRLFVEYVAEHRSGGEADPRAYLSRASPAAQRELAALIDAYLARAPRQRLDPSTFRNSSAERTVDDLERAFAGDSGLWPAILPRLRDRAGIKRSELVRRLATVLGVSNQSDKVAAYYHQMEQGSLPATGVSDQVLDALAGIVGETRHALRDAGQALVSPSRGGPSRGGPVFARKAYAEAAAAAPAEAAPPEAEWDAVDRLFRGG